MNFLVGDGSVRTITPNIDLQLFQDLATIAGGETLANF